MARHPRPASLRSWLALAAVLVFGAAPASAQKDVTYRAEQDGHRLTVSKTQGSLGICSIELTNLTHGSEMAMAIMINQYGRRTILVMGSTTPSTATAGPTIFRVAHGGDGPAKASPLILEVKPNGQFFTAQGGLNAEDADSLLASRRWEFSDRARTRLGAIEPPASLSAAALLKFEACRATLN